MRIQSLHTLVAIARIGSFARTAEEQNSTLPTVSMQMKALEEQLGCALFDRSFRPPTLTPLGRKVAEQSKRILAEEEKLRRTCAGEEELVGLYRLGFIATASVRLLPGFLKQARSRFPNADFELETGLSESLENKVQSGQLEAAIVTASDAPLPGLHYMHLRDEPLVYALPGQYADTPLEEVSRDSTFLQFNPISGIGKLIQSHVIAKLPSVTETIILDSVEAIMECVNQELGFTLLAEEDVKRYRSHNTVTRSPGEINLSRNLALVTPAQNASIQMRQALTDLFG